MGTYTAYEFEDVLPGSASVLRFFIVRCEQNDQSHGRCQQQRTKK